MLFTPLFAVILAGATVIYAVTGLGSVFDRELLGVFDALLMVETTSPVGAIGSCGSQLGICL